MKIKHLLLLLLLTLVLLPRPAKSQLFLGIGESGIMGLPDTASWGDTASFSYYVVNRGILPSVSPIYTFQMVNGIAIPGALDSLLVIIPPGDSALMTVNQYIFNNQTHGQTGTNTIVIWPGPGTGVGSQDSAKEEVVIREDVSIDRDLPPLEITAYPNPVSETLHLQMPNEALLVESLSLYDIHGKLLQNHRGMQREVDFSSLQPGIYFLQIHAKGRLPARLKILKQ